MEKKRIVGLDLMRVVFALLIFIRIVVLIAQLYFAITVANTRIMQKLGGFAAVVVFFAVFIVMQCRENQPSHSRK